MTWVAILLLLAVSSQTTSSYSADNKSEFIAPTKPGSSERDYAARGYLKEGSVLYPTKPGTQTRDYTAPGLIIEDGKMYPTKPGSSERDYNPPKQGKK
jgi:hypothetical protein